VEQAGKPVSVSEKIKTGFRACSKNTKQDYVIDYWWSVKLSLFKHYPVDLTN
jgi:hypothetical protein